METCSDDSFPNNGSTFHNIMLIQTISIWNFTWGFNLSLRQGKLTIVCNKSTICNKGFSGSQKREQGMIMQRLYFMIWGRSTPHANSILARLISLQDFSIYNHLKAYIFFFIHMHFCNLYNTLFRKLVWSESEKSELVFVNHSKNKGQMLTNRDLTNPWKNVIVLRKLEMAIKFEIRFSKKFKAY
jgi:hypothetical protein